MTISAGALAQSAPAGFSISGGWFRLVMPSLPAAGYFTLSNASARPRALVGAASPACGMLMLHQTVSKNGEEQMVMAPRVPLPAHGAVRFAPGGYHLMCMSPGAAMRVGQSVPVTLRLDDGATVEARFAVRGATGN